MKIERLHKFTLTSCIGLIAIALPLLIMVILAIFCHGYKQENKRLRDEINKEKATTIHECNADTVVVLNN